MNCIHPPALLANCTKWRTTLALSPSLSPTTVLVHEVRGKVPVLQKHGLKSKKKLLGHVQNAINAPSASGKLPTPDLCPGQASLCLGLKKSRPSYAASLHAELSKQRSSLGGQIYQHQHGRLPQGCRACHEQVNIDLLKNVFLTFKRQCDFRWKVNSQGGVEV